MKTEQGYDIVQAVIKKALQNGADAADAVLGTGRSLDVTWRGGKVEALEHSEGGDLGLRVLIGKKQACVATTDYSPEVLDQTVERAVAMAKSASEDPYCGIADPAQIAKQIAQIEMADAYELDVDAALSRAKEAEEVALSVQGVSQCESTSSGGSQSQIVLGISNGFIGGYTRTHYWTSASVVAGEGTQMEADSDYTSVVFQSDLESPSAIARRAAERAIKSLGARKMPTCQVPVVLDPRVSRDMLGCLIGAISGAAIARGTSFLKDYLGKQIFPQGVHVIDDPLRARGPRSKAFDGEGIATQRRAFVEDGVLQSWILDLRSARKLGLQTTGNASRGTSGLPHPSPTNFFFEAGQISPADLMQDIKSGFYVTEFMGFGVNEVTGDFSQAARGFWIENGQVTFPVNEMTVAGNLKDMFMNLHLANDLTFKYGVDAPTLRIEGLTVAGF